MANPTHPYFLKPRRLTCELLEERRMLSITSITLQSSYDESYLDYDGTDTIWQYESGSSTISDTMLVLQNGNGVASLWLGATSDGRETLRWKFNEENADMYWTVVGEEQSTDGWIFAELEWNMGNDQPERSFTLTVWEDANNNGVCEPGENGKTIGIIVEWAKVSLCVNQPTPGSDAPIAINYTGTSVSDLFNIQSYLSGDVGHTYWDIRAGDALTSSPVFSQYSSIPNHSWGYSYISGNPMDGIAQTGNFVTNGMCIIESYNQTDVYQSYTITSIADYLALLEYTQNKVDNPGMYKLMDDAFGESHQCTNVAIGALEAAGIDIPIDKQSQQVGLPQNLTNHILQAISVGYGSYIHDVAPFIYQQAISGVYYITYVGYSPGALGVYLTSEGATQGNFANVPSSVLNSPQVNSFMLTAPTGFQCVDVTPGDVSLSWNVSPDATGYELLYRKTGDFAWMPWDVMQTTETVDGLQSGTEYQFRIRSITHFGYSDWVAITVTTEGEVIDERTVALDMPNTGVGNHWTVYGNNDEIFIIDTASSLIRSFSLEDFDRLVINADTSSNDSLTIDFSRGGSFLLDRGVEFNGNAETFNTLALLGTADNDSVKFTASEQSFNELSLIARDVERIDFNGLEGTDDMVFEGAAAMDIFRFADGSVTFETSNTVFRANQVENIAVNAKTFGGKATLTFSEDIGTFYVSDDDCVMVVGGYRLELKHFDIIEAAVKSRDNKTNLYVEDDSLVILNDLYAECRSENRFFRLWYADQVVVINSSETDGMILHTGSRTHDNFVLEENYGTATNSNGSYFQEFVGFKNMVISSPIMSQSVSLPTMTGYTQENNIAKWTQNDFTAAIWGNVDIIARDASTLPQEITLALDRALPFETASWEGTTAVSVDAQPILPPQSPERMDYEGLHDGLYTFLAVEHIRMNKQKDKRSAPDDEADHWMAEFQRVTMLECRSRGFLGDG